MVSIAPASWSCPCSFCSETIWAGDEAHTAKTWRSSAGFRITALGFVFEGSLFAVEVMPSARYQAELFKDIFAFAELGLGWSTYQITLAQQFVGYQYGGASGFGVRLAAGIEYRLLDQLRILVQPVELTALTLSTTTTQGGTTITQSVGESQFSMILGLVVPL